MLVLVDLMELGVASSHGVGGFQTNHHIAELHAAKRRHNSHLPTWEFLSMLALTAGFVVPIFRRNLHLMWFLPAFALYELYEIL